MMILKVIGGLLIAYAIANYLLWTFMNVDLGSFIILNNTDWTPVVAGIAGAALFWLGGRFGSREEGSSGSDQA